jgi:hypothetical protein
MGDWNLDKKSLSCDNNCNIVNLQHSNFLLQDMTKNVEFMFSVGDTTRGVYNWYWARQIELVKLNAIFSPPLRTFIAFQMCTIWVKIGGSLATHVIHNFGRKIMK